MQVTWVPPLYNEKEKQNSLGLATGPQTLLSLSIFDTERHSTTVAPSHTPWGLSITPLWNSSSLPI